MNLRRRPDHKLVELRSIPLLRTCPEAELHCFARIADPSVHRTGVTLAEEGRPQRWFHLLAEGRAQVWTGGQHTVTLDAGDTIGEAAVLAGGLATATVTTEGPGRTYVLSTPQLRGLLAECPVIAGNLLEKLSHKVVDLETARTTAASPRLRLVPTAAG